MSKETTACMHKIDNADLRGGFICIQIVLKRRRRKKKKD
jgi:hypothetical protein